MKDSLCRPLLSIVTVVKDDLNGLILTTQSIMQQNNINIQHIIVDGGSTDGSEKYALEHSDVHVQSKNDGGVYFGMKRGALIAEGRFLMFLNSGDYLCEKNDLAQVLSLMDKESADWGFGPVIEKSLRNTEILTREGTTFNVESIAFRKTFVPFPTSIFLKSFYDSLGGVQTNYRIASDFELILKATLATKPVYWGVPLVKFAAGGISYTLAPLSWEEEHEIRKSLLKLTKVRIFHSWFRVQLRKSKWRLGKLADFVYDKGLIRGKHWRDLRGQNFNNAKLSPNSTHFPRDNGRLSK